MDVCHFLLGRPWKYDRQIIYDGFKNTYTFCKDGHKIFLAPMKPTMAPASKPVEQNSLLSKSELEKEIRAGSEVMALVAIEETESEKEIPKEVEHILAEFVYVVPEEIPHGLPPMRYIQHQIDLVPGFVLPNKPAYRISPKEHEELTRQVDELLNKGLIRESKSPDAGASINTPNIGNSALIIEELDWGGQDALNTCENSFFGPHLGLGRQKNVIRLGQTPDVNPRS